MCVDHWHHRQARDTLSKRDFHADMNNRAINLLALGNCAAQSSYDYIVSYLNDTDTHLTLRTHAAKALAKYKDRPEVSNTLSYECVTILYFFNIFILQYSIVNQLINFQAADLLLKLVLFDGEDVVKRVAEKGYQEHPDGGRLAAVLDTKHNK